MHVLPRLLSFFAALLLCYVLPYAALAQTYSLGNRVWLDRNGDGIRQAAEGGVGNVLVYLYDAADQLVGQQTTPASGYYRFDGLAAGTYYVGVALPANHRSTRDTAGSADPNTDIDNDDNGVIEVEGYIFSGYITLGPGGSEPTNDGGDLGPGGQGGPDNQANMTLDFGLVPEDDDDLLASLMPLIAKIATNRPPVVTVIAPTAAQTFILPRDQRINLRANASDPDSDGRIRSVEFLINDAVVGTGTLETGITYRYEWNVAGIGNYRVNARATDNLGKSTLSAPINFQVISNTVPTVTFRNPPARVLINSVTQWRVHAVDPNPGNNVVRVDFFANTALIGQGLPCGTDEYCVNWTAPGTAQPVTIRAEARDTSNQVGTATHSVQVINNAPPSIFFTTNNPANNPPQVDSRGTVTFRVSVNDPDVGQTLTTRFYANNNQFGQTQGGPGEYTMSWTAPNVSEPEVVTIRAEVTDNFDASAQAAHQIAVTVLPNATEVDFSAGTSNVGMTEGSFQVGDSGGASYSISIQVPPGTAGMQPSLSLTYNSQGGNGHLGVGWALSGLSAIHRCPSTEAQDGIRRGINYDNNVGNDNYCLDGQRLISVSGQQADVGGLCGPPVGNPFNRIEYSTEIEGYSRIIACIERTPQTVVVGPALFRVFTKAGQSMWYGRRWAVSSGGFFQNQFGTGRLNSIKTWILDRVEDRAGNYILIDYADRRRQDREGFLDSLLLLARFEPECPGAGPETSPDPRPVGAFPFVEYWPTEIRYYAAGADRCGSGYNFVRFNYEDRSADDWHALYDSGAGEARITKRMTGIETYIDGQYTAARHQLYPSSGTLVKSYRVNYQQSGASARSLIRSIQECAPGNICLAPTEFTWQSSGANFQGAGSGTFNILDFGELQRDVRTGDINGDGLSDFVRVLHRTDRAEFNWLICRNTGVGLGFECSQSGQVGDWFERNWFLADMNGDGRADLAVGSRNGVFVCLSDGTNFRNCSKWSTSRDPRGDDSWYAADADGDGKTDILVYGGDGNWHICLSTDYSFSCRQSAISGSPPVTGSTVQRHVLHADVNGDGKTDLIQRRFSDGAVDQWRICLSRFGLGENPQEWHCHNDWVDGVNGGIEWISVLFDFNGDGIADMATHDPIGGGRADAWKVCISSGDRSFEFRDPNLRPHSEGGFVDSQGNRITTEEQFFAQPRCRYWYGPAHGVNLVQFGDVNGDGRTDIIAKYNDSASPDMLVCLSTGSGFNCSFWPHVLGTGMDGIRDLFSGDFNGDGKTDYARHVGGNQWRIANAGNGFADLLSTVTTGLGAITTITYAPLTDSSVYTKGTIPSDPREIAIQSPMYVVKQVSASTGTGSNYTTTYRYHGLKGDTRGRGLFGFAEREMTDGNNITTIIRSHQDFGAATPRCDLDQPGWTVAGRPYQVLKRYAGQTINQVDTTWACRNLRSGIYEVHAVQTSEQSWELNANGGGALPFTRTESPLGFIDAYGNVTDITVETSDGYTKRTVNTYAPADTTHWILGRLTQSQVTHTSPAGSQTRTSAFHYYGFSGDPECVSGGTRGFLCKEIIEPNDTSVLWHETKYRYDGFGNKIEARARFREPNSSVTERTSSSTYDAQGRFPTSTTNAAGHQTRSITHDARFGAMTGSISPNSIRSESRYDGFGRKTLESVRDASNNLLAQSAMRIDPAISGNERYVVHTKSSGGAESKSYFDELQREIRSEVKTFAGSFVTAGRVNYNALGQRTSAAKITAQQDGNSLERSTLWFYDPLNRMTREERPDGGHTLYGYAVETYDGHPRAKTTLTARNPSDFNQDQVSSRTVNSQAQVIRVIDAHNKTSTYSYDPLGNLSQVVGPTGISKTMGYDRRGRKISMNDPDMGNWTYTYNGAGELKSQTDARSISTTFDYDVLSRPTLRFEGGVRTDWSYDICFRGIGQVCSVQTGNVSRQVNYDEQARAFRTVTTVQAGKSYISHSLYDSQGRVGYVGYPLSKLSEPALGVRQRYNSAGFMNAVVDAHSGANYWQALSRYADGQLYQMRFGNNLTTTQSNFDNLGRPNSVNVPGVHTSSYGFDRFGNVNARSINITGAPPLNQSFGYDKLNRMTSGAGHTASYDDAGNLLSRSDVPGAYSYVNGTHRLSQQGANTYSYDANGNVLNDGRRNISPNNFNLPTTITQGGTTLSYTYDAEHQRVIEQVSGGATTYYVGSGFFEEVSEGANTSWRHYITSPEGAIALVTRANNQATTNRYWHKDHLGSIIAITNEAGGITQGFHFAPWGGRTLVVGGGQPEPRGYTGHEMLDEVGFIHMNGRIYDPVLGRFVQADPVVNAIYNPQDLNRYAYVLNNPLLFTDPTGFSSLRRWIRPIVAIAVAYFIGYFDWSLIGGAAGGGIFGGGVTLANAAAAGFAAGGIQGGNLKSALYGAFTASLFWGIGTLNLSYGTNIAAHAMVGCGASAAQGGSCRAGALSAGFAEAAGPLLKDIKTVSGELVARTVVGGIGSVLGGGKFENGAVTAAFGYLFNHFAGKRHINSRPGGEGGPEITLINDDPRGKSPDRPVDPRLAEVVEGAAVACTCDLNVNSTNGGKHGANSLHYAGLAADINRVDGIRVDTLGPDAQNMQRLMDYFRLHPEVRELFGPNYIMKWNPGGLLTSFPDSRGFMNLLRQHMNHIHIGVFRSSPERLGN